MIVTRTLHGKDFRAEMCKCEQEEIYLQQIDRKVLKHDVCEAAPESRDCSKEGVELPE